MKKHSISSNPNILQKDVGSFEFFILKDDSIIVKNDKDKVEVPNKSEWVSYGRVSPYSKKVMFWPQSINITKAIELLKASNLIDGSYSYSSSSEAVKNKAKNLKDTSNVIRKIEIERLIDKGMVVQEKPELNE